MAADGNINDLNPDDLAPAPQPVGGNLNSVDPNDIATPDQAAQAKYGTLDQQAINFAEQAASGLTQGLSKKFETESGLATPGDISGRSEANPIGTFVANAGGTGALIAGTSGAGLLPQAETALGRLAVGTGIGAEIGAANQASDDWSQNKPLDAQRILSAGGYGGLLGLGGAALFEAGAGALSGVQKAKTFFSNIDAGGGGGGGSYAQKIKQGYQAASIDPVALAKETTSHLQTLADSSKQAARNMYEEAGQFHLGNALEDMQPDRALELAQQTIDQVKDLTIPGEGESPASNLSMSARGKVTDSLQKLSSSLENAGSSLDVHNAMTEFASDIDKGIKFDKIANAINPTDPEILGEIRDTVRGNLKDPDLWGPAADIYSNLSKNYADYKNSLKAFQKDFMVKRPQMNGQSTYELDPSKVTSWLKDPEANTRNVFRNETIDNFVNASLKNAQYAENYEAYQKGVDDLSDKISGLGKNVISNVNKAAFVKRIQLAKKGYGEPGLGSWIVIDSLPAPLRPAALLLRRYAGSSGAYTAGGDLAHGLKVASKIGSAINKSNQRISNGVGEIFGSSKK